MSCGKYSQKIDFSILYIQDSIEIDQYAIISTKNHPKNLDKTIFIYLKCKLYILIHFNEILNIKKILLEFFR